MFDADLFHEIGARQIMRCEPGMQAGRAVWCGERLRVMISVVLVAVVLTGAVSTRASATNIKGCNSVGGHSDVSYDSHSVQVHSPDVSGEVAFKVIEKIRLRRVMGHCVVGSKRYRFRQEIHGITVKADLKGRKVTRKFVCTNARYTTPAGQACEREVRRIDWKAPARIWNRYR